MVEIAHHFSEVQRNLKRWEEKALLREIYEDFYRSISANLNHDVYGEIVELGSGIGKITKIIPTCIRTDLFEAPWIERVENIYKLTSPNASISNLILFDVFHHLKYPGNALKEFHRVLVDSGRVIIFEPCMSLLGFIVYGLLHREPLGLMKKIEWTAESIDVLNHQEYYAAQGNTSRIFSNKKYLSQLSTHWKLKKIIRISSLSYVASGGYSKVQLYPESLLPVMKRIDKFCDKFPQIFATRMLVVIEKKFVV